MKNIITIILSLTLLTACAAALPNELKETPLGAQKSKVLANFPDALPLPVDFYDEELRTSTQSTDCYTADRYEEPQTFKKFTLCFDKDEIFETLIYKKASDSKFTRSTSQVILSY